MRDAVLEDSAISNFEIAIMRISHGLEFILWLTILNSSHCARPEYVVPKIHVVCPAANTGITIVPGGYWYYAKRFEVKPFLVVTIAGSVHLRDQQWHKLRHW